MKFDHFFKLILLEYDNQPYLRRSLLLLRASRLKRWTPKALVVKLKTRRLRTRSPPCELFELPGSLLSTARLLLFEVSEEERGEECEVGG